MLRRSHRGLRGKAAVLAVATSAALALTAAGASGTAFAASRPGPDRALLKTATDSGEQYSAGRYIVMFRGMPAVAYRGGIKGLPATKVRPGQHLATRSAAVVAYRSHLRATHAQALTRVGVNPRSALYNYTTAFNGVAVDLSAAEATALAKQPDVVKLFEDQKRTVDTNVSPGYLGLSAPGGLWDQLGGAGRRGAGKGVVVGVIDTGIWPENPGVKAAKLKAPVPGWTGICQTGEDFTASDCNRKLIGARYFVEGFGEENLLPEEFLSPRDYDGHGTHTGTTAAGHRTQAIVDGTDYGTISGMAPGAYLAAYKALWTDATGTNSGNSTDLTAAIDQAVADGVDVINFSIGSGSEGSVLGPEEVAFLFAADAGVFVAASAGNEGPDASTTDHVSPWLTSTAASTYKISEQAAVLGDGTRYVGASSTGSLPATPAVLAADIAKPGADPAEAALCFAGTLAPYKAAGKVVVCDRGVNARIDKSAEVAAADGVGMVLVNIGPNSLEADLHFVPTVHLDDIDGAALKEYVATDPSPTVAISPLKAGESTTVIPQIAEFSSRGPSLTTGGDVLKPDIAAPGVNVLAGISPVTDYGRDFDMLSGTSMASPHIAGIAALMRQAHPDWSTAAIKSALQTSARNTKGTTSPFEQGAGLVRPNTAVDPGLVYNTGLKGWLRFLEGNQGIDIDGIKGIDGSDLNQASIAIGALAGRQTITRRVLNVSDRTLKVSASVKGLPGVKVKVSPSSLTVPAGRSARFTVTFTTTTAPLDTYSTGKISWVGNGYRVRSPVAVQPTGVSAPSEVVGTGTSGSTDVSVTPGFTGTLDSTVYGLAKGDVQSGSVNIDPNAFDPADPQSGPAVKAYPITVPAGSTALRVAVDGANDADDLDLWVYDADGNLVGLSATGSGDEVVTLPGIPAGDYTAYVHGFAAAGAAASTTFDIATFVVGDSDEGNLTVTPSSASVTLASPVDLTFAWSGLDADAPYLGWVGYSRGGELVGFTLVSIG